MIPGSVSPPTLFSGKRRAPAFDWTVVDMPFGNKAAWNSIAKLGANYVCGCESGLYLSTDGLATFTRVYTGKVSVVVANSAIYVALLYAGADSKLITSPDGTNWTERAWPFTGFTPGFDNSFGASLAVGDDYFINVPTSFDVGFQNVWKSTDGITWVISPTGIPKTATAGTLGTTFGFPVWAGTFWVVGGYDDSWSGSATGHKGGATSKSADAVTWVTTAQAEPDSTLRSYSNLQWDGTKVVAIRSVVTFGGGYNGTSIDIMESANGSVWTGHAAPTNFNEGVGTSNFKYLRQSGTLLIFQGHLTAGVNAGKTGVSVSTDHGDTWSAGAYIAAAPSLAAVHAGITISGDYVVVPNNESTKYSYTANGTVWAQPATTMPVAQKLTWIGAQWNPDDGYYLAVCNNSRAIATSHDGGVTWVAIQDVMATYANGDLFYIPCLSWNGNVWTGVTTDTFVVVGSADLMTWTRKAIGTVSSYFTAAAPSGGRIVVIEEGGADYYTSDNDGGTWDLRTLPNNYDSNSMVHNGAVFAISNWDNDKITTSADGGTWVDHATGTVGWWSDITNFGSDLVAINDAGYSGVSHDNGANWTLAFDAAMANMGYIAVADDVLVTATYSNNKTGSSYDGLTWTVNLTPVLDAMNVNDIFGDAGAAHAIAVTYAVSAYASPA